MTDGSAPTTAPSKRLVFLEQLVAAGKADSFARYALGMEYRKAGRIEDAVTAFEGLRDADPAYVAQYLMAGQLLTEAGRAVEARAWLTAGLAAADRGGDSHARGELEGALAAL